MRQRITLPKPRLRQRRRTSKERERPSKSTATVVTLAVIRKALQHLWQLISMRLWVLSKTKASNLRSRHQFDQQANCQFSQDSNQSNPVESADQRHRTAYQGWPVVMVPVVDHRAQSPSEEIGGAVWAYPSEKQTNKQKLKIGVDMESDLPTESVGRVTAHTQRDFATLAGHNDVTSRQWIITSCNATQGQGSTSANTPTSYARTKPHSLCELCLGTLWSTLVVDLPLCLTYSVLATLAT